MSKIFYDHLIDLSSVEKELKKHVKDPEDRAEVYQLIDEIAHHRVVGCILDSLPHEHHTEFLTKLSQHPHDQSLMKYVTDRVSKDAEHFIREELYLLGIELLSLIKPHSEVVEENKG